MARWKLKACTPPVLSIPGRMAISIYKPVHCTCAGRTIPDQLPTEL